MNKLRLIIVLVTILLIQTQTQVVKVNLDRLARSDITDSPLLSLADCYDGKVNIQV